MSRRFTPRDRLYSEKASSSEGEGRGEADGEENDGTQKEEEERTEGSGFKWHAEEFYQTDYVR